MAFKLLSIKLNGDILTDDYEYPVTDFGLLGFEISEDDKYLDFYIGFLANIQDDQPQILIVKNSYEIGNQKDLDYLRSPLNNAVNFSEMSKNDSSKEIIELVHSHMDENKVLLSNLIPISEDEDTNDMIVEIIGNENGKFFKSKLKLSLSVYIRLQMIKSEINNHMPINFILDSEKMFDSFIFYDNAKIDYYGSDYSQNKMIIAFFKMEYESHKDALMSIVPEIEGKIVTKSSVDKNLIESYFDKVYGIDLRNVFLFEKCTDGENIETQVGILLVTKEYKVSIFRLDCSYEKCALLHPYDFVY